MPFINCCHSLTVCIIALFYSILKECMSLICSNQWWIVHFLSLEVNFSNLDMFVKCCVWDSWQWRVMERHCQWPGAHAWPANTKKWSWLGHTLRWWQHWQTLQWTLKGHRGRRRQMNMWKRDMEKKHGQQLEVQPEEDGCRSTSQEVQKNRGFFKKRATHWVLLGFGLCSVSDFVLEWAVRKLVVWFSSSAKLLFRFDRTLNYLKICKFITYWLLETVNIKKSLITTSMTNQVYCFFGYYPCRRVSEPWQDGWLVTSGLWPMFQ